MQRVACKCKTCNGSLLQRLLPQLPLVLLTQLGLLFGLPTLRRAARRVRRPRRWLGAGRVVNIDVVRVELQRVKGHTNLELLLRPEPAVSRVELLWRCGECLAAYNPPRAA